MSIAGGYYKAVERAQQAGCDCVQVFTKNNNQWNAAPIQDDDASKFQQTLDELKISHPLSHSSYLLNLASPDPQLRRKSIDALVIELQRAEQLQIPYVVLHPGSFTTSDERTGIKNIVRSLDEVHGQTRQLKARCLLENTAGQGTNLGRTLEQLAEMVNGVKEPDSLGICLDTCHALAAGYPLAQQDQYDAFIHEIDQLLGVQRVKAIHLNDSKRELGSRVDRHEQIGHGHLGLDPFSPIAQ